MNDERILSVSPMASNDLFYTNRDFYTAISLRGRRLLIVIKKPFGTDGLSIPRPLWSVVLTPFSPRGMVPAVVHDHTYRTGGVFVVDTEYFERNGEQKIVFLPVTRREADNILCDLAKQNGMSTTVAEVLHAGLFVGGWVAWNRYRKLDTKWEYRTGGTF